MKVNLSAIMCDLRGEPIKDQEGNDLTIAIVITNALLTPFPDEEKLSGDEKVKRFKLALRVDEGGDQDLSIDDIALIKKLIGKAYPALTVGRAYEILDPEPHEIKEAKRKAN